MHHVYGVLPLLYVPVCVTCNALVAHPYTYALRPAATSHYHSFYSISISLCNDLADPVFDCVGLAGFKSGVNAFLLA